MDKRRIKEGFTKGLVIALIASSPIVSAKMIKNYNNSKNIERIEKIEKISIEYNASNYIVVANFAKGVYEAVNKYEKDISYEITEDEQGNLKVIAKKRSIDKNHVVKTVSYEVEGAEKEAIEEAVINESNNFRNYKKDFELKRVYEVSKNDDDTYHITYKIVADAYKTVDLQGNEYYRSIVMNGTVIGDKLYFDGPDEFTSYYDENGELITYVDKVEEYECEKTTDENGHTVLIASHGGKLVGNKEVVENRYYFDFNWFEKESIENQIKDINSLTK